jgi:hypothetical protein
MGMFTNPKLIEPFQIGRMVVGDSGWRHASLGVLHRGRIVGIGRPGGWLVRCGLVEAAGMTKVLLVFHRGTAPRPDGYDYQDEDDDKENGSEEVAHAAR